MVERKGGGCTLASEARAGQRLSPPSPPLARPIWSQPGTDRVFLGRRGRCHGLCAAAGASLGSLPGSRSHLCVSALLRGYWNSELGLGREAGGVTRVLKGKGVSGHRARGGAALSSGPSWSVRHHGGASGQGPCAEGQGPDEYLLSVGRSRFCDGTDGHCPCGR